MCPKNEAILHNRLSAGQIKLKYIHETPKNVQQASWNDVKCFERILAKMLSLKDVIWPYLPKLLIDDFGIVIGADQVLQIRKLSNN